MWSQLQRGSSPVDWCESNYSISPVIAEFVNTISNVLFFLFPPVLIHLFKEYAKFINPAINILWILLMVIGISSAYFHATLSLVGQLLDELAILWLFMASFAMFLPRRYFPKFLGGNRYSRQQRHLSRPTYTKSMWGSSDVSVADCTLRYNTVRLENEKILGFYSSVFSVFSTGFLIMHPAANAFALMTLTLPTLGYLYIEMKSVKCARVYRLGLRSVAVCLLAVFCWIMDRLFCDAWLSINFPYMHGVWHVLIFIASYTALVLSAYFNVLEESPQHKPQLKYWPKNDFELGVPYIAIKHPFKSDNNLAI